MIHALITEYFCATFQDDELPEIALEGYAMLRTLIESLCKIRSVKIHTIISKKLLNILELPNNVNIIEVCSEDEFLNKIDVVSKTCDLAYLIAPPNELSQIVSLTSCSVCSFKDKNYVIDFSNKLKTIENLYTIDDVKIPKTLVVRKNVEFHELLKLKPPLIVKPVDNTGGIGQKIITKLDEISLAIDYAFRNTSRNIILIQEFINGIHASISVIGYDDRIICIVPNIQLLTFQDNYVKYFGGITPLTKYYDTMLNIVQKIVKRFKIQGYIGIDIVVKDNDVYIIEVNPRITTSIIGIDKVVNNLGEFLIKSCIGQVDFEIHDKIKNFKKLIYFVKTRRNHVNKVESLYQISIKDLDEIFIIGQVSNVNELFSTFTKLNIQIPNYLHRLMNV